MRRVALPGTIRPPLGKTFGSRSAIAPRIEQAFGARPTGVERADAINIRIPIEGAEKPAEATA
jgi:hypothetical protein